MKRLLAFGALLLVATAPAASQQRLLSVQGYVEQDGTPVSGSHQVQFILWTQLSGGVNKWSETHATVQFDDGVFSALLGGQTTLEGIDLIEVPYIEFGIDGQYIVPRTRLASAPSALTVVTPLTLANTVASGVVLNVINHETGSVNYAIDAKSYSPSGYGVRGEASATTSGSGKGVIGVSKLTGGSSAGVYGTGPYGVWGQSAYGPAVYGSTTATDGAPIGVHGQTSSPFGSGVRGSTTGAAGPAKGVWGSTHTSQGYGGYFEGGIALYARAVDNATPDIVVAGNSGSNDNGWLSSDPYYSSSDLVLSTNDDINIQLDRNNDDDGVFWISANGTGTSIFQIEEDGDVRVNGSLVHSSDRAAKERFQTVDPEEVLRALAAIPVLKWSYWGKDATHMGPIAQDFMQAFQLGEDETGIATVDADGVSMAAIQGLYQIVKEQQVEIEQLRAEIQRVVGSAK